MPSPIPEITREGVKIDPAEDEVSLWERLQEMSLEKVLSEPSARQRMNRAMKRVQ